MSKDSCVFCELVEGQQDIEIVLETDNFLCFYDQYPVNKGHTLVIPKTHVRHLENIDDMRIFEVLQQALEIVNERHNPDATNIGLNNGEAAGQTIPHLHWHIIPRYEGDMDNPEGGVRGVIPEERTYR